MALPKIANKFSGAIQKTEQEQKVAELQAEIERLRAAQSPDLENELQELREQLQNQSGESQIDLALIDPNPDQPRQTITPELIQAKARLLKKHGQISAVILIPQGNGRYTLLDGQLRTEAAKLLGWSTICAVIAAMPKDLDQSALLTFLGFEDLNPLDKAEAVFKEVIKSTDLEMDEVATMLGTVIKRVERDGNSKELAKLMAVNADEQQQGLELLGITGREQSLLGVLLELGLNPSSVKANLMPMLYLSPDLKQAIREQGLKGAHALALATLSAKTLDISENQAASERMMATDEVLKKNLTVAETRELIRNIKTKYLKSQKKELKEIKTILQKVNGISEDLLTRASSKQLQEMRSLLQQKLAEVEKVIAVSEW
ncbi:ParB/RepB/Spo0J family partition protein [Anabaena sp. PCC 7938]|uniref:ParB/RepB/Spo0J family partition protein n=1 Tax=Anabaena sp. PCC 7938 TaxID=1296340 RepID=UPI002033FB8F|nr:ParB N-terminal domain-containing protein [Anabaena sp. CCAP 1446/1C]MCM2408071.1 ParB N-terminal domain-containing protein [Anabaena sp. CCAP 1446/1C]